MPFSTTLKLGDVLDFSQAAQDAPQQIESGDFNGDGKLDFLITRAKGEGAVAAGFRLMMGQGNGQWLDQTTAMFGGVVPTVTYTASVIVADCNVLPGLQLSIWTITTRFSPSTNLSARLPVSSWMSHLASRSSESQV